MIYEYTSEGELKEVREFRGSRLFKDSRGNSWSAIVTRGYFESPYALDDSDMTLAFLDCLTNYYIQADLLNTSQYKDLIVELIRRACTNIPHSQLGIYLACLGVDIKSAPITFEYIPEGCFVKSPRGYYKMIIKEGNLVEVRRDNCSVIKDFPEILKGDKLRTELLMRYLVHFRL